MAIGGSRLAVLIGEGDVRLFSLSSRQRLERNFQRLNVEVSADEADRSGAESLIFVRADHAYEERLLSDLVARDDCIIFREDESGKKLAVAAHVSADNAQGVGDLVRDGADLVSAPLPDGIAALSAIDLSSSYNHALRKIEAPLLEPLGLRPTVEVERQLFGNSYKGVTDLVTKYAWPFPAFHVTRFCAALKLTPNFVTMLSFLAVIWVFQLFWNGAFLTGIFVAWLMCFLDTVDGKLARTTLQSSWWGNIFDHGIDLIHPPFWYWAWWVGLLHAWVGPMAFTEPQLEIMLWIIVGGYLFGRAEEGIFLRLFDMQIHCWEKVDSQFRLITARRNPNLLLLMAATLAGRPDWGFALVAAWTILSILFHGVRIAQAAFVAKPLTSWLDRPQEVG